VLVFQLANAFSAEISGIAEKTVIPIGGDGLFAAVLMNAGGHLWFLLALLTTLLPTALHLCLAIWALGPALLPAGLKASASRAIDGAERSSVTEHGAVLTALAAWCAVACLLPLGALFLAFHIFDRIGADLLAEALTFFIWFGALFGS